MQGSDKLHVMSKSIPHPTKNRKGRYSPQEHCPLDRIRRTKPPQTRRLGNQSFLNDPSSMATTQGTRCEEQTHNTDGC